MCKLADLEQTLRTARIDTWKFTADRVLTAHTCSQARADAVLDGSVRSDPLVYIQGHGNLVAALEKALEGLPYEASLVVGSPSPTVTARGMNC